MIKKIMLIGALIAPLSIIASQRKQNYIYMPRSVMGYSQESDHDWLEAVLSQNMDRLKAIERSNTVESATDSQHAKDATSVAANSAAASAALPIQILNTGKNDSSAEIQANRAPASKTTPVRQVEDDTDAELQALRAAVAPIAPVHNVKAGKVDERSVVASAAQNMAPNRNIFTEMFLEAENITRTLEYANHPIPETSLKEMLNNFSNNKDFSKAEPETHQRFMNNIFRQLREYLRRFDLDAREQVAPAVRQIAHPASVGKVEEGLAVVASAAAASTAVERVRSSHAKKEDDAVVGRTSFVPDMIASYNKDLNAREKTEFLNWLFNEITYQTHCLTEKMNNDQRTMLNALPKTKDEQVWKTIFDRNLKVIEDHGSKHPMRLWTIAHRLPDKLRPVLNRSYDRDRLSIDQLPMYLVDLRRIQKAVIETESASVSASAVAAAAAADRPRGFVPGGPALTDSHE